MTSSPALAPLVCPKCNGEMRTYERSGVHVDQCRDCRGLFLDRGELERLMDLEAAFAARSAPAWTQPDADDRDRDRDRRDARPDPVPPPAADHRRSERGEGLGDLAELGGIGGLGSLAELGELFERDSGRRQTPDPRTGQPAAPRKRGGLFRELFEGFGD